MQKLQNVLNKHRGRLLSMKNVVGVGIGYKDSVAASTGNSPLGVVVLVKNKLPEAELEAFNVVPKDLDGVVTDVIEVGDLRLLNRTDSSAPAQPGVSIGHYRITAGTFGAVVKDRETGEPLILSNNHVLANGTDGHDNRAKQGDPILLPGPHDGGTLDNNVIGRLYKFQPVTKVLTEAKACPKAAAAELWMNALFRMMAPAYSVKVLRQSENENVIDAALAKPVNPQKLNPNILELGNVNGVAEAEVGMAVAKSGRTTGVTKGTVKAVHATVQVEMDDGQSAVFHDQIIATPMSQGGDSGALVLDNQRRAVGLLFAGSDKTTVFNRIQNVMEKLNITF